MQCKKSLTVFIILLIVYCTIACTVKKSYPYGVFLGLNNSDIKRLTDYDTIVIEPAEFSAGDIEKLHHDNKKIYAYINIGAIEEYRPYFSRFKNITLDIYEDWPDERWVDVSSKKWLEFIVDNLGKKYAEMGFDGFFLDNADVYYHYPDENIFNGLCNILLGLKKYNITLIINGGDTFVAECIDKNIAKNLFNGINQESVFTNHDDLGETLNYYKEYLKNVKNASLDVYLLEYSADATLSKEIEKYCTDNGFIWYNAASKSLK